VWFHDPVSTGPLSVAQRLNLRLHRIFLALLFLVAVLNCFGPMLDNVDLGWHIAQGRWMVHHLGFYRADVFNYPTLGHPVVDEYPLFQIILYLSTLAGLGGPCLLAALGYVLLLAILLLAGWLLDLGPSATFSLILGLMLLYLGLAFPLRPHLVTFLGIAAFGSFLLRHREAATWTRFWPLALMQVFWTNCHSGFVLGPVMVAGFGAEMVLRRWVRNRDFPWTALRIWAGATALVFLGCFVNPWGVLRFGAPFYQGHLEAIRAYTGEMQPLNPGAASNINHLTLIAALLVAYVVFLRRGAVSWSFLLFALAFYLEALQVQKAWPLFGMFLPLLVLSSGAFARTTITRRKSIAWFSVGGHIVVLVGLLLALIIDFDGKYDDSLAIRWREWDAGRTELPVAAAAWLKQNRINGRLLHRCEDGGWLQEQKILPTWADTGFGKYDEAFIRQTGLLGLNPDLLPTFLALYKPDLVICDGFAFQWPVYLKAAGGRLVNYSPNSSVWAANGVRPDLPAISLPQAEAIFTADLRRNGLPRKLTLYGRDLIALHSMGDSAFAVGQLQGLPADLHHAGWYWEAARIMCFQFPPAPQELRARLRAEADAIGDPALDFRAYDDAARGDLAGAEKLLAGKSSLSDVEATLLLRIEKQQHRPAALELARRRSLFDLTNGEHWQDLAELEDQANNISAAAEAYRKLLYYAPERDASGVHSFFLRHPGQSAGPAFLTDDPFALPDKNPAAR
jgi:hypothetical protein